MKTIVNLFRLPWRTAVLYMLYLMADWRTRKEFRDFAKSYGTWGDQLSPHSPLQPNPRDNFLCGDV